MKAAELETDTPTPDELADLANALPDPTAAVESELRARLERTADQTTRPAGGEWPPLLEEPRLRADSRYADPATSHRPYVGPVLVAAKRGFRLAFQPFINEVLRRQVEFNESILGSLAIIYEQVRVNAQTQAMWRRELDERVKALEAAATKAKAKAKKKS